MVGKEIALMGIGGHAVALDMKEGSELWRTRLGSDWLAGTSIVSIQRHGTRVLAAVAGEVFCLDAANGRVIWQNKLSGLGVGPVCFSSEDAVVQMGQVQHDLQT